MPCLPSEIHYCIDDRPLRDLLRRIRFGRQLEDLRRIQNEDDLRHWLRFLWLLPLGADSPPHSHYDHRSMPMPDCLTLVDSGHRLDDLPEELTPQDRVSFEEFWQSPRCRFWLAERLDELRTIQFLLGYRTTASHAQNPESQDRPSHEDAGLPAGGCVMSGRENFEVPPPMSHPL